jgi:hypothetical protein
MTAGRKSASAPASKELAINATAVRADFTTVAELGAQEQERVTALAHQIGYDGSLTVGSLEDEIRFYQRRTVEAILETGKRLLLLQELTPRGEFDARAELLGFSRRTAYRFMQAASKTAKSAKLAQISAQIKNGSAFLELVTHDDEELKTLEGMDDVDRMSASQLRAAFRDMKAEKEAVDQLVETKNKIIDRQKVEIKRFEKLPPDEKMQALQKDASDAMNDASGAILGRMRNAFLALVNLGDDRHEHDVFLTGLVGQVQARLTELREEFNLPDVSNAADAQLVAEMTQWSK